MRPTPFAALVAAVVLAGSLPACAPETPTEVECRELRLHMHKLANRPPARRSAAGDARFIAQCTEAGVLTRTEFECLTDAISEAQAGRCVEMADKRERLEIPEPGPDPD